MIPCYVLIPLTYNDGTRVEKEVREDILDGIWIEFGGWRHEGTRRGAYKRRDTGEKQVEITQRVLISVDDEDGVRKLREAVSKIGALLGQESMYFEVARGSTVEFVSSPEKGGQSRD